MLIIIKFVLKITPSDHERTIIFPKNIISFFIIIQLKIEVSDYLVCSFNIFLVIHDFFVHLTLHSYKLLDFCKIFISTRTLHE